MFLWSVGTLLLLGLGTRMALPLAVRLGLGYAIHSSLGHPTTVGNVDLWLWRGAIAIEDITITTDPDLTAESRANSGASHELLQGHRFYASIDWKSLLRGELRLRRVLVDGTILPCLRESDGRIVLPLLQSLVPHRADDGTDSWPIHIDQLHVRGLRVTIWDNPLLDGGNAHIAGALPQVDESQTSGAQTIPSQDPDTPLLDVVVQMDAADVSTNSGATSKMRIELTMGEGIVWMDGRLGLDPPTFEGQLSWRDISLPALANVLPPPTATWFGDGRTTAQLSVVPSSVMDEADDSLIEYAIQGRVTVDEVSLASPGSKDCALAWRRLEVDIRKIVVPPWQSNDLGKAIQIELGVVRLADPLVKHTRPPDALKSLLAVWDTGSQTPPSQGPAMEITLEDFSLSGGVVQYLDRTVSPYYRTKAHDLAASARELQWPRFNGKDIRVTGIIGEATPFELTGQANNATGELSFKVDRVDVTPLNPYATDLAGYRIDRGQVSLTSSMKFDTTRFEANNTLVLHRLDLSLHGDPKAPRPLKLPNKFELAVLRDPKGDIRLPIHLSVDRQGTSTKLGPIITSAVQQAVMGAITSPLKTIGAVFKPGQKDEIAIEPFQAIAGSPELIDGESDRVEQLALFLASHPGLGVVVTGGAGDTDRPYLAHQILIESAVAGRPLPKIPFVDWFARRRIIDALVDRSRGETGRLDPDDEALLDRYRAAVEVSSDQVHQLALSRAQWLSDHLAKEHGLSANRIRVIDTKSLDAPQVLVELVVTKNGSTNANQ